MRRRLEALEVADAVLHQRALAELDGRLATWWGSSLPAPRRIRPKLSGLVSGAIDLPIVLTPNPIELLMLRAFATAEPALFGVTQEGALHTIDADNGYRIFITLLSPLLDEVSALFQIVDSGKHRRFIEDDECFFAVYATTGEYRPFAVIGSERVTAVADRCLDVLGRPLYLSPSIPSLLVDFKGGDWPIHGVLSEMGYHVGITNGLAPIARRHILRKVVDAVLIGTSLGAQDHLRDWGGPRSENRIAKVARCLGNFASQARHRSADMSEAIADWESDLRWLRETYGR